MCKTVLCHVSKEQFYVILENLSKVHYKVKRWKTITAEVNRSILSAFNSYSIKSAVARDFRQLLQYPLCPVPLSTCSGNVTRRRTNKSKQKEVLLH